MIFRKDAAIALAVGSLLACAGFARAESSKAPELSLDQSVVNLAATAPEGLLMGGLDRIGAAKPLQSAGLNVYGFVEAGYIYNPNRSEGEGNVGHVFTFNNHNNFMLNQVDVAIERLVDLKKFDVGGKVEVIYGQDSDFIHSHGMNFYAGETFDSPTWQFDIVQAYVDVAIPVGNGLRIRGGKFVTLMGYETINPNNNPFYSHSLLFNYAINFTETGILGTYNLNDQWTASLGVVRGWEQSLEDNNGSPSVVGQVGYTPTKSLQMYFNFMVGPEGVGVDTPIGSRGLPVHNATGATGYYSNIYDFVANYAITDQWSVGLNADVGCTHDYGFAGDWYGIALYTGYRINDYVTANARGEWFFDNRGTRGERTVIHTNAFGNVDLPTLGVSENMWEVTLGLTIKPFPKDAVGSNLKIRPEIRYDQAEDQIFSGGSNNHQVTIGADVIFTF